MATEQKKSAIAVIGSGPGGAVAAALLAEAGRDVMLIEEGPQLPLESCQPFSLEEMVQKYRNGGLTLAMGNPKVQYVEGRVVGGGSEINSGLYHRTPPEMLEQWKTDFQLAESSPDQMTPHFQANERDLSVSPWPGELLPPSKKMQEGAQKLGWKSLEVPRWFKYPPHSTGPITGEKQSMSKTFVQRAQAAGCKIATGIRIQSIRRNGSNWHLTGISTDPRSPRQIEIVSESVFVAAGAIQTPAILRRSGIKHNIGDSLSMHPTVKLVANFPEDVNFPGLGVAAHQVKDTSAQVSLGCSVSSQPYLAVAMSDYPADARRIVADWPKSLVYYAMTRGEGHGTVRPIPGYTDPLVRYKVTDAELKRLATGLRKLAKLMLAAGATSMYPSVTGWKISSRDDLPKIPAILPRKGSSLMTIHLFSSCPMGENKSRTATDSFGKVHNTDNLYIADASLLCSAPGVNPQGSIMAFVRRNILQFLGML